MSKRVARAARKARGPVLDAETRQRRAALENMKKMSPREMFELAVRAGVYTPDGKLTPEYGGPPRR